MRCEQRVAARRLEVVRHHFLHHRFETGPGLPAEPAARLARIAEQRVDFRRTEVLRVDRDDRLSHHDPGRLVAVNGGNDAAFVDSILAEDTTVDIFIRLGLPETADVPVVTKADSVR